MILTREITNAILACVRGAINNAMNDKRNRYEEVWLSKEEFLKQFGMFTEGWLKEYGESLPRSAAEVMDKNGNVHATRWAYPRNQIQEMIMDGRIKQLVAKRNG